MPRPKKAVPTPAEQPAQTEARVGVVGLTPSPVACAGAEKPALTALDQFACALLADNTGVFNPDNEGAALALERRIRDAYKRAQVMLRVRAEFI